MTVADTYNNVYLLDQRMYVSVAVGNQRMKTEVYKKKTDDKTPPTWNQEFTL